MAPALAFLQLEALGSHLLQSPLLLLFPPANRSQVRRLLDAQLSPQVVHIPLQLLLPKDIDYVLTPYAVLNRPRHVHPEKASPLGRLQRGHGQHAEARHRQQRVGEFKRLERHLALSDRGQTRQGVVKVMALAVPLHHVGALLVVNVLDRRARVWRHPLAVQPLDIGAAHGVCRQRAQGRHGQRLGADARPQAKDATACGVCEHGVAEAVDEIGGCRGLAQGGYEICKIPHQLRTRIHHVFDLHLAWPPSLCPPGT